MNKLLFAAAKSLQSCPTLCDPIDGSLPGSSVQGIFQARVLEWGATAFSGSFCLVTTKVMYVKHLIRVWAQCELLNKLVMKIWKKKEKSLTACFQKKGKYTIKKQFINKHAIFYFLFSSKSENVA